MQRDISLRRGQRQDHDQIRGASVKEINRKDKNWSATGLFPAAGWVKIGKPNFATVRIRHVVLNAVAQSNVQLPQLGLPRFPRFFILAEPRIRQISAFEEQTASFIFDGLSEHFLQ
jgi:hypothetical protein